MNIQQLIVDGIKELLFDHDYLVVPGFGGFVLKTLPAHYNSAGGELRPPAKYVTFNVQLKQDDGLLFNWLQRKIATDSKIVRQHLEDFTAYCHGVLNTRHRLTLNGIGFFFLDFEGNISFEPQHDVNFNISSFGLTGVQLPTLPKVQVTNVEPKIVELPKAPEKQKTIRVRRLALPMAATIAITGLIAMLLAYGNFRGPLNASFFTPTSGNPCYHPLEYPVIAGPTPAPKEIVYVADANGIATVQLNNGAKLFVKAVETQDKKQSPVQVCHGDVEIVAGCFSIRANAVKLIKKMKKLGVNACISGKTQKGMHVVSVAYESRSEANSHLETVRKVSRNAWIRDVAH